MREKGFCMIDNSIRHIKNAIADLDKEMENIVMNLTLSLKEKDNLMLPILLEKKVLKQTLEDLEYLKANPPAPDQPCGISKYRTDT